MLTRSFQVQRLSRKLQASESANADLKGAVHEVEQKHMVEVTLGRKNQKQLIRLQQEFETLQVRAAGLLSRNGLFTGCLQGVYWLW